MKKSSFTTPLAAKWSKCGVENEAIGGGGGGGHTGTISWTPKKNIFSGAKVAHFA